MDALTESIEVSVAQHNGAPLTLQSLRYVHQERVWPGDEVMVRDGMGEMVNTLEVTLRGKEVKIWLLEEVIEIIYNEEGVEIRSLTGKTWKGNTVVVALPLGVLQCRSPRFHPPLPLDMRKRLQCIGNGVLNKAILKFSHSWWPNNVDYFVFPGDRKASSGTLHGSFMIYFNMDRLHPECHILMVFLDAACSKTLSMLTPQDLRHAFHQHLSPYFSDIEPPKEVHLTRWHQDRYAMGSYTYMRVGGQGPEDVVRARRELWDTKGRLRVAWVGEWTELRDFSYVHGAWLSGKRVTEVLTRERRKGKL